MIRLLMVSRKTVSNAVIRRFCTPLSSLSIAQLKEKIQGYELPMHDIFEKREFVERIQEHEAKAHRAEIVDEEAMPSSSNTGGIQVDEEAFRDATEFTTEHLDDFKHSSHEEKMSFLKGFGLEDQDAEIIENMVKGKQNNSAQQERLVRTMMENMNPDQWEQFVEIGRDPRLQQMMQDIQDGKQPDYNDPAVREAMEKLRKIKMS